MKRGAHFSVDANHEAIVRALRQVGCSVTSLAAVGHGLPDLLVGYRQGNYLLEVKSSGGTLTDDERCWQQFWRGHVAVVRSIVEALAAVGVEMMP